MAFLDFYDKVQICNYYFEVPYVWPILGTTSLSDFFLLNAYVFYTDSKVNSAEAFKTHAPTAMKVVEKMIGQCDKIKGAVEKAQQGQFCPFWLNLSGKTFRFMRNKIDSNWISDIYDL